MKFEILRLREQVDATQCTQRVCGVCSRPFQLDTILAPRPTTAGSTSTTAGSPITMDTAQTATTSSSQAERPPVVTSHAEMTPVVTSHAEMTPVVTSHAEVTPVVTSDVEMIPAPTSPVETPPVTVVISSEDSSSSDEDEIPALPVRAKKTSPAPAAKAKKTSPAPPAKAKNASSMPHAKVKKSTKALPAKAKNTSQVLPAKAKKTSSTPRGKAKKTSPVSSGSASRQVNKHCEKGQPQPPSPASGGTQSRTTKKPARQLYRSQFNSAVSSCCQSGVTVIEAGSGGLYRNPEYREMITRYKHKAGAWFDALDGVLGLESSKWTVMHAVMWQNCCQPSCLTGWHWSVSSLVTALAWLVTSVIQVYWCCSVVAVVVYQLHMCLSNGDIASLCTENNCY